MSKIQQAAEFTPQWLNWLTIAGGAVLAWIQPVAGLVAIAWGCVQLYTAWKTKPWRKDRDGRSR